MFWQIFCGILPTFLCLESHQGKIISCVTVVWRPQWVFISMLPQRNVSKSTDCLYKCMIQSPLVTWRRSSCFSWAGAGSWTQSVCWNFLGHNIFIRIFIWLFNIYTLCVDKRERGREGESVCVCVIQMSLCTWLGHRAKGVVRRFFIPLPNM